MPFSLMAISDRRSLSGDGGLLDWLDRLAEARIQAVQLREKDLDDRSFFELATEARKRLPSSTRLLINGRADIVQASGADGVHLPVSSVPARAIRKHWGTRFLLGCSTHSQGEVDAAREADADYVTFGPVFSTPSKTNFGDPLGLSALSAAHGAGLPILALGGVTRESFSQLADAGATGAAGIRLFQQVSSDLIQTARDARAAFQSL